MNTYEKRPTYVKGHPCVLQIFTRTRGHGVWGKRRTRRKRDQCMWKGTCMCVTNNHRHYRTLCLWKETYTYKKRPTYVEEDLYVLHEQPQALEDTVYAKRDISVWKEIYVCERHICVLRTFTGTRGHCVCEMRRVYVKRDPHTWTETDMCVTNNYRHKRTLCMWKEMYRYEERPMYMKGHTCVCHEQSQALEDIVYAKRDV